MVKLLGLIDGLAAGLQIPASRVRTAAAVLRKHKLISSGPRGPGAPVMTPTDATNLLLALLYDDELAICQDTVSRLRAATFEHAWEHHRGRRPESTKTLAPHRFLRDTAGNPVPLGEVLDTMLDWFVRYGTLEEGLDLENPTPEQEDEWQHYAINISLKMSSPLHRCNIHIDAFETIWDLEYRWKSEDELAYAALGPKQGIDFRTRFDALKGPYVSTSRTIGEDGLNAIADVLRDRPMEDADDRRDIVAPYDKSPGWLLVDDANLEGAD